MIKLKRGRSEANNLALGHAVSTRMNDTRSSRPLVYPSSSMSTPQVLQLLYALDKSSPEFVRLLYTFIRLDEKGEYSLNLQRSESASLVDFLDEV